MTFHTIFQRIIFHNKIIYLYKLENAWHILNISHCKGFPGGVVVRNHLPMQIPGIRQSLEEWQSSSILPKVQEQRGQPGRSQSINAVKSQTQKDQHTHTASTRIECIMLIFQCVPTQLLLNV